MHRLYVNLVDNKIKPMKSFVKIMVIGALNLFAVSSSLSSQERIGNESRKIDELLTKYHDLNRLNGVVMVAKKGEKILSKGYGSASLEWNIPNSPDAKYLLASVSKTFTATVIMKLIDQRKLHLDTKLTEVLPWYRKDTGEKVTIFHLLNHSSGIPNYMDLRKHSIDELNREFGTAIIDKTEFARKYCSSDLEFEPGTKWNYNNSGYFLLALIVEQITGEPFNIAMKEIIFDPLQMNNSGDLQQNPEQVVDKLATGYLKAGDAFTRMHYWNLSTAFGAGSLYSTPDDLLKFDQSFYSDKFLSSKAKDVMFTPFLNGYGCGWELRKSPMGTKLEMKNIQTHEGFLWAWHTRLYSIPEDSIFITIISNTGDSPLEKIFTGITDLLYGRIPEFPKPTLSLEVEKQIKTNGIDEAISYGKFQLGQNTGEWECHENDLNALGYRLLKADLNDQAVKIFLWNTEIYPELWNVWDSYGEGLAAVGNIQVAIEAYQKSLKLNGDNKAGAEILKKLQSR